MSYDSVLPFLIISAHSPASLSLSDLEEINLSIIIMHTHDNSEVYNGEIIDKPTIKSDSYKS
jgi:hypothetical protein